MSATGRSARAQDRQFPVHQYRGVRYPLSEAAETAVETVVNYMRLNTGSVETATFVLFDDRTLDAYEASLRRRSKL